MSLSQHEMIQKVLDAVSENNVELGLEVIDPSVTLHLDELSVQGVASWSHWVHYLHSPKKKKVHCFDILFQDIRPDLVVVEGKLRVDEQKEGTFRVEYRFQNGKIIEIRSTRNNYKTFLGKSILFGPVLYWHCLKMWIKKKC